MLTAPVSSVRSVRSVRSARSIRSVRPARAARSGVHVGMSDAAVPSVATRRRPKIFRLRASAAATISSTSLESQFEELRARYVVGRPSSKARDALQVTLTEPFPYHALPPRRNPEANLIPIYRRIMGDQLTPILAYVRHRPLTDPPFPP